MSRQLVIVPNGWPCSLAECPPGFFVHSSMISGNALCFKTQYRTNSGEIEAYNEAGEFFCGETNTNIDRVNLMVQPVTYVWEDV